jgi:hypothetical protein
MICIESAPAEYLAQMNLDEFDLVFIDDSTTVKDRCDTISAAAKRVAGKALIVIHDFEEPRYQIAAATFESSFVFRDYVPSTGVLGHRSTINCNALRRLQKTIAAERWRIAASDAGAWLERLRPLCHEELSQPLGQ